MAQTSDSPGSRGAARRPPGGSGGRRRQGAGAGYRRALSFSRASAQGAPGRAQRKVCRQGIRRRLPSVSARAAGRWLLRKVRGA